MNRSTMVHMYNGSKRNIGALLDIFGPHFVANGSGITSKYGLFVFADGSGIQQHATLSLQYKVYRNVLNGRPMHHISKKDGKLKKRYNKPLRAALLRELLEIPHQYNQEQHTKAAIKLQAVCRGHLVRNALKLVRELKDVDVTTDPITAERLTKPVIIVPDWNSGNKVIYNQSTIFNCASTKRLPMYEIDDVLYEYEVPLVDPHTGSYVYKSPMTRREFHYTDVMFVGKTKWYKMLKSR